jgi:predicted metal-binding protein
MSRKIVDQVPGEQLKLDLEKYRQRALDLGATSASVISADMVVIDERVRAKCINPKCDWYGTCASCPPLAPDLDFVRKVVNNFRSGIFFRIKAPSAVLVGKTEEDKKTSAALTLKNAEIVSKIESEAFHDGYYLALGLANGSCKVAYCKNVPCNALLGNGCRQALRARASMEGWGMDAYLMATRAGWDMYAIGRSTPPEDVPHGTRLGLVLVY